jgi:hypothetical protein
MSPGGRLETIGVFTGRDASESIAFPGLRVIPDDVFAA